MGSIPDLETTSHTSRISTVVPATPRRDQNCEFQLTYMDLLMKLHYIRPVYFFASEAVQGLTISDFKKPMFMLLDTYSHVSGRIRRSEAGRPFIKCNDAGVRIAEAYSDKTLKEWFHENGSYSVDGMVHDHVLGPDVSFSPLVFVKFTWFKCGGLSIGLSWAHVLGDAFSAFNFITKWSHILSGHMPPKSLHNPILSEPQFPQNSTFENPISIKKARVIGEYWLGANDNDVATHSFHFTFKQLQHLVTPKSTFGYTTKTKTKTKTSYFEVISAMLLKYIAHIRGEFGPKFVTICTSNISNREENECPNNGFVLSKFEADLASDISDLARLIAEKKMVENHIMKKLVESDEGKEDFIVYGSNLTFVDLEEAEIYGVKLNGHKPIMANCTFRGVGDEGVVLVLPPPPEDNGGGSNGRIVTVSLPEKELNQLKDKIVEEWSIV